MTKANSIVMLGATGVVGSEALNTLVMHEELEKITLLGRREKKPH